MSEESGSETAGQGTPSSGVDTESIVSPLSGAIGIVLTATAAVALMNPVLVPSDPQFIAVHAIAIVTILLGLWFIIRRVFASVSEASVPAVERRRTTSIPGSDAEESLHGSFPTHGDRILAQKELYERVRTVAVDVLTTVRPEFDVESAEESLESGDWTDDPRAAAYLSDVQPEPSVADRLAGLVPRRTDRFVERTEAIVTELARRYLGDWSGAAFDRTDPARLDDSRASPIGLRQTDRWRGVGGLSLLAIGLGAGLGESALVLLVAPLLLIVGFAAIDAEPPGVVSVERTIEPTDPDPGEEVVVTVRITNDSGRFLPDLRVVDGVPPGMNVSDGTPRHGTALGPGAETWFRYRVTAERGSHTFESPYVLVRNLSGSLERVARPSATGDGRLAYRVRPSLSEDFPLRSHASSHVGRVLTDIGGSGLEFHSVREYRTGDPLSRIDWKRAAQGEDLATLQFREERSATVVLLLDTRKEAYLAPGPTAPSAVDRSVRAATDVFLTLQNSDDRVGLAALSPRWSWLSPGAGHVHWTRAEKMLTEDQAFSTVPPSQPLYPHIRLARIRKRLPSRAQIVLFSPLCDDEVVSVARELTAYGYPMTVVSPDPTTTETVGATLARIERRLRLSELRRTDARVVDWRGDERLPVAIDRAKGRWSR